LNYKLFNLRRTQMNSTRSLIDSVTDNVIHINVLVPVQPSRAFEYFTKTELLTTWLTAASEVQPEVGGKFELFWEPDNRENNSTIGCRITALKAGQLIAFQWRGPKQYKSLTNGADPLTHVVVSFFPENSGTRIHLVHTGWRSSPEWEEARAWQQQAWSGAMAKLEQTVGNERS